MGSNIVTRVNDNVASSKRVVSTSNLYTIPKFISVRIRLHSPNRARGRSVVAKYGTTTTNNIADLLTVPGAGPAASDPRVMGCVLSGTGSTSDHICITTDIAGKLGDRRPASVSTIGDTNTVTLASSNEPIRGAGCLDSTVGGTPGLNVAVITRYRSLFLTSNNGVGRNRISRGLNIGKVPTNTRSYKATERVTLTTTLSRPVRVYRIDAGADITLVHSTGEENIGIATRATPRCISLASERLLENSTSCEVGPPLEARTSISRVVGKLYSNALSTVTASRTPRAPRRGTSFMGTPGNSVNVRASFTIYGACLIGANEVALSRLIRGVDIGPTEVLGVGTNALSINTGTSIILVGPSRR